MFKKILVPIDNSDDGYSAVRVGVKIAKLCRSSLTFIHVINPKFHDAAFKRLEVVLPDYVKDERHLAYERMLHKGLITKGLKKIAISYLRKANNIALQENFQATTKVRAGKNFEEICHEAEENSYDLIVMGIQGLGKGSLSLVGSVTENVVRLAKCPVLAIRSNPKLDFKKILIALDKSDYQKRILSVGLSLSQLFKSEVGFVHVFNPVFHSIAFQRLDYTLSQRTKDELKIEKQKRLHTDLIDGGLYKLAQKFLIEASKEAQSNFPVQTFIIRGKPEEAIINLAKNRGFDLVVLGQYGDGKARTSIIGSTAENVLRFSSTSVMIVK